MSLGLVLITAFLSRELGDRYKPNSFAYEAHKLGQVV